MSSPDNSIKSPKQEKTIEYAPKIDLQKNKYYAQ